MSEPTSSTGTPGAEVVDPTTHPGVDRRKQVVAGLVTVAVLAVVFVGIFPKFANYSDAWASIQKMSLGAVAALLAVTVLNIVVYVFPYNAALPGISYGDAFNVRQTSFMISNAVPAGGAFGLGVQYAMLNGYGFGPAVASSVIGVTSVWNLLVTLALPVLGVLALITQGQVTSAEVWGAVGGLVALGLIVAGLALVLRSEGWARRIGAWGDHLVHRFRPSSSATAATDGLLRFRDQTVDVVRDRWALITAANFGQQMCQFLVLLVAIYGLGGTSTGVNPAEIFAAFALARLAGFIPITPGGLGTVDAALVGLLSAFGMSRDEALAANLLWRACTFIPQVVIGIVTFLIWRAQTSHRRRPDAEPVRA
jgi:uncharacterized protein (TIRG00374 family)